MSKSVLKEKFFLILLLSTEKEQARALLDTVTNNQVSVISEIIYNCQQLTLPKKAALLFKRRKLYLSKISNKSISVNTRKQLIRSHYRQLLDTLLSIKNKLLELLQ